MDKRKIYGIMLDTETANTIVEEDGKLEMAYVLPYDLGFAVIDSKGNIYEKFSFVIDEIFCQEWELMKSAYYAQKIPQYIRELASGQRQLKTAFEVRQILLDKIKEYDCQFVCAHNMRFDYRACNNLQRWTTKSKYRYFFPYGTQIWDSLKMARQAFGEDEDYATFCSKHQLKTPTGKTSFTAENLYRYLTNDATFVESHTGLEDVLIEKEIFAECVRRGITDGKLW